MFEYGLPNKELKVSNYRDFKNELIKEGDFLKALDYKGLDVSFPDSQIIEVVFEDNDFYVENSYASKLSLDLFMLDNVVNIVEKEVAR
jgi:hypothetical protein